MFDVAVVGSANMDFVCQVDRFPKPGETVVGREFRSITGGKGANQAVAAARAGADVTFLGSLGNDDFGDVLLRNLSEELVDVKFVVRGSDQPTGVAMILVDSSGQNQIVVAPGANDAWDRPGIDDFMPLASHYLVQLEIDPQVAKTAIAAASGRTIFDPAPASRLPERFPWRLVSIVTPNETEAEAIVGIRPDDHASCAAAADAFLNLGVETAILTLGGRGCYWKSATGEEFVPPFPVDAVDATAAGDAFNGYLACRLARGDDLPTAIRWAAAAGALAASKWGAQPSIPRREAVEALLTLG